MFLRQLKREHLKIMLSLDKSTFCNRLRVLPLKMLLCYDFTQYQLLFYISLYDLTGDDGVYYSVLAELYFYLVFIAKR